MTSSLSKINNGTAEQRGLTQNQSVMLFRIIEGGPTKVENARLVGKRGNIVRRIYGAICPLEEGKHLVRIPRPTIDRADAEIRYSYFLSVSEDPPHLLSGTVTAGICVWNSRKLFFVDGETGAKNRRSHVNVDAIGLALTVSATTAPSNMQPVESETAVPVSIGDGSANAPKPIIVSDNTPFENMNKTEPKNFDPVGSLVSSLDENAEKSVVLRQF